MLILIICDGEGRSCCFLRCSGSSARRLDSRVSSLVEVTSSLRVWYCLMLSFLLSTPVRVFPSRQALWHLGSLRSKSVELKSLPLAHFWFLFYCTKLVQIRKSNCYSSTICRLIWDPCSSQRYTMTNSPKLHSSAPISEYGPQVPMSQRKSTTRNRMRK